MALALADLRAVASWPKDPYPGLRPFESDEWQIFFGRESMIDDVISRMARQRLVFIHGASGSGKSSLVRAGVLPKLRFRHLRYGAEWLTCTVRPSGGPLWNLAQEFAKLEERADDTHRVGEIIRLFNRRGSTLAKVAGALSGLAGKRLCILVDQFEELFRFERETSREEAELFVRLLTGTVELDAEGAGDPKSSPPRPADVGQEANIHVIITMRSEFLGECARYDSLAEAFNLTQYLVPRMKREALVRAIRRPAQLYGGDVTPALADRLVADARGREDELPLIQHGLMQMWHEAKAADPNRKVVLDAEQLTLAGGLAALLSDHADRVMSAVVTASDVNDPLDEKSEKARAKTQTVVERLFRALTDINAEQRAIRRPQRFRDLVVVCGTPSEHLREVIDAFRADGVSFLSPYFPASIDDETHIDIGHEALIRCWRKVADPQSGWLQREFSDGLVWKTLVLGAVIFQNDRRQMLSAVTAAQRSRWLDERSKLWSERYGGHWEAVKDLVETSDRRGERRNRWSLIVKLFIALLGVFSAVTLVPMPPSIDEVAAKGISLGISSLVFGVLIVVLLFKIAADYLREFGEWGARQGWF